MMCSPRFRACGCALLFAILAGCERVEPHAVRIVAPDAPGLARWRRSVATRYSGAEWREFDGALQQIRAQVSATAKTRHPEAIEAATYAMIDGRTWREVQLLGAEAEVARLSALRAELKSNIDGNALLVTHGRDGDSARTLQEFRARQEERLRELDAQIATAQKRRAAFGGAEPDAGAPSAAMTTARPLSRADARLEIDTIMASRRERAQVRFGASRVKFDHEGSALTGEVRDEFLAARTAAAQTGDAVVAVRVKNKWWIFTGSAKPPQFSAAVTANLTPADRATIERDWIELEAEVWAREQAWNQPTDPAEAAAKARRRLAPSAGSPRIGPPEIERPTPPQIVPENRPPTRLP